MKAMMSSGNCDAVFEYCGMGSERKRERSMTQSLNKIKSKIKDTSVDVSKVKKYSRGVIRFKNDKETHTSLRKVRKETQHHIVNSAESNAVAEILLTAEAGYVESEEKKVFKITQEELKDYVDMNTSRNILDLHLPVLGPYLIKYSRNGRYKLFGGRKGHLAMVDCHTSAVKLEMQLQEALHDVQYLHDESLVAVAQTKYVYLYDTRGIEIHCMKRHERPYALDFLPYHLLLVSTGHSGWIKWHDVSTGQYVGGHGSGYGPCYVLTHNPQNAVSHMGHSNGVISLWSPISSKSLVSLFAHKAPVSDIAINKEGTSMVTSGLDGFVKVWDLRMCKQLLSFKPEQPVISLDMSDTALLALGMRRSVQLFKDVLSNPCSSSYLQHELNFSEVPNTSAGTRKLSSNVSICNVAFRPFEDVLSIGHSHGISDIVVPGSGEVNFDSYENNPYANLKQRQETEIKSLMMKLEPGMIEISRQFAGLADEDKKEVISTASNLEPAKTSSKKRARGRNKISAKLRRMQKNVLDASVVKLKGKIQKLNMGTRYELSGGRKSENDANEGDALSRFTKISSEIASINRESNRRVA